MSNDEHRLPLHVKPTHYDLQIKTDLEKLTFEGAVQVHLDVLKDTNKIVFHTSQLNIQSVTFSNNGQGEQKPTSVEHDEKTERTTLSLDKTLTSGSKVELDIKYDAKLTGSMMGYYFSAWEDNGKKKHFTLTQFEPTAARRAFPCWDEPLLKATYTVAMISRADSTNLSNMPAVSEEVLPSASGEWKITRFEKTPPVSSYLVAFANGHFDYIEDSYKSPLSGKTRPLRVYATKDNIGQAQYCLDIKKRVLPLYETVFEIEYPLPKLDTLIANDFDAGAMENWGLITGRTSAFMLDPAKPTVAAMKRVASVQSHEVAHMWFGNITTMAWWDNLYLNEGFATLMGEVIIMNKIYPDWKANTEFITEFLNSALKLDAKLSSHPIEVECPDANKINQIFDNLSYDKAASVLRMLSAFVGEEKFLKGVSLYLKKHLYANTVSKDLWDGISEAVGMDITPMMTTWVSKMGFPYLTVTEKADGIQICQNRFLGNGAPTPEQNETIWQIPLNLAYVDAAGKKKIDRTLLMQDREMFVKVDTSKPYKLNADTTGVYRVLYPSQRLSSIATAAAKDESAFSVEDRLGLVHDAFELAKAGFGQASAALELVNHFRNEKEYLVWQGIGEKLMFFLLVWYQNDRVSEKLAEFIRGLWFPIVKTLGYEYSDNESSDIKQLRTQAIHIAAVTDEPSVVKELNARFNKFVETGDDSCIPGDLERTIYCNVVRNGSWDEFKAMKNIFKNPRNPNNHLAAIGGLCSAKDPEILEEVFKMIFKETRDQDIVYFFRDLRANKYARRRIAEYFMQNYAEIWEHFSANTQLNSLVAKAFETLNSEKEAQEVEAFFKDKDTSKFDLSLSQALDSIRANAAILQRSTDDVIQWLEKRN